jgi:hypothetical protein
MASIGWAKFGITTDTTGLRKGVHTAVDEMKRLKEQVLHVVEAFAVFEVAKRAFETIKGSIEGISQTKILAERVGMSAEAFGKLTYSARLAHVQQDELATSLEQMSKRLGEVAMEGSGPAADALKRLGLSAGKLARMGNEGAFYKILSVMEQIQNPAQRSAVAMDLFGRSGMGMINMMAQGAEEIKKNGDEAMRLGSALSDIDVAKVEEADRAFIKLQEAGEGFTKMLAVQLAPYITYVTEKYLEFGYGGAKSSTFIARGLDMIQGGLGYVLDVINELKAAWYAAQSAATLFVEANVKVIEHLLNQWNWVIDKMATVAQWMAKIAGKSAEAQKAVGDSIRNSGFAQGGKGAEDFFKTYGEDLDRLRKEQWKNATDAFDKVGSGKATITNLMDEFNAAANRRAEAAAGKGNAFVHPGRIAAKVEPTKFAAATDFGSKEAYSAALRSRSTSQNRSEQRQIVKNTERTADGVQRTAQVLERMAGAGGGRGGREGKLMLDHPGAF